MLNDHIESKAAKVRLLVAKQVANVAASTPPSAELAAMAYQYKDDTRLVEDLNYTSIDSYALFLALEEAFEITIGDEDAGKLNTVGEVIALVYVKTKHGETCRNL